MSIQGNLTDLATKPIARLLWDYSLPAVTGMVVMQLYHIIDRIFIGRGVGADAIAGLAITFPVMNLATALGVLIGAGASARVSIHLGAGNKEGAQRVLGNALVLSLGIGLCYICMFGIFMPEILRAFGASDNTLPYAYDFMMWLLPGMLMINLTFSFNNVMRASGYPRRAMYTMILGAVCNVILAPIFIFGFGLGIKGAAIATDIAMSITMVFVMWHFVQRGNTLTFVRGYFGLRWRTVWSIVSIGLAPSLVNAAACLINVLINHSLVRYGNDMAVGAAGIFTTYTTLIVTVVLGICMGMQPIVGYNYGAGHMHRLKRCVWLATGVSTGLCVVGSIAGLTLPDIITRCFTVDPTLITTTRHAFSTALWAFAVVGFQVVATNFFQSIGMAWKAIVLSLSRQVIFMIPLLLTLPPLLGLTGVWMSFPLSDIMATIVTALFMWYEMRRLPSGSRPDGQMI